MKQTPHLSAGLTAIFAMVVALVSFNYYARSLEMKYVDPLATLDVQQILSGDALQNAAFQSHDLLPVYGSSEITIEDTPYQASRLFKTYPTGFNVYNIAKVGDSSLNIAQSLAAVGPTLAGKKVVISFTPEGFTTRTELNELVYTGNFSHLHAYELIFSPYLSMNLKRMAATRMLDYPLSLENDPLLKFALTNLASKSRLGAFFYYLTWPLGELQLIVFRLQDHAAVVSLIYAHPDLTAERSHIPGVINWPELISRARLEQIAHTANNPYGVEDIKWKYFRDIAKEPYPAGSEDKKFIKMLNTSQEWNDLAIVLQVLKELGARPLLLSRPMNGLLWQAMGVTPATQTMYYTKLRTVVDPYHFPLIDYQQYTMDKYFSIDTSSHTSREGWVYVDRTLDEFFHGLIR